MSNAEMHAFEEAMMDDPLLADAVDGYRSAAEKTNVNDDLSHLAKKLNLASTQSTKLVKGSFRQWMSIAAGLLILLSASVVLYRIFGKNDETATETVAKNTTADTVSQPQTVVDSTTVAVNEKPVSVTKPVTILAPGLQEPDQLKQTKREPGTLKAEAKADEEANEESATVITTPASSPPANKPSGIVTNESEETVKMNRRESTTVKLNKFTGQVIDESNQPLAFANVREKTSGVGTYTDAKGYFTIISSDSVVSVETRSAGYTNTSAQLRTNQQQKIIMKDETIIANAPTREQLYKRNRRANIDSTDVHTTEPADGWSNYNAYVLNNNREAEMNERYKKRQQKEVELSFNVNPDGSLSDIKVEKSNCKSCNAEAIRLLKEGPRWKSRTGKTERTKYIIQF